MRAAKAPNGGTGVNRCRSHACVKGCDEPCVHGHRSAQILQWTPVADLLHMVNGRSPSPSIGWTAWLIETSSHRRTGVLGRLHRGQ